MSILDNLEPYINPYNNPMGVHIKKAPKECKHKIVPEGTRLICEYCEETFKF